MRKPINAKPSAAACENAFGMTFGITFFLTVLTVPFVLATAGQEKMSGGAFVVFLLGALVVSLPVFAKSVIIAASVFFPVVRVASLLLPIRIAYIAAAATAAYLSATVALWVDIDVFPPAISLGNQSWWFASMVGGIAMVVALVVSSLQMVAGNTNA